MRPAFLSMLYRAKQLHKSIRITVNVCNVSGDWTHFRPEHLLSCVMFCVLASNFQNTVKKFRNVNVELKSNLFLLDFSERVHGFSSELDFLKSWINTTWTSIIISIGSLLIILSDTNRNMIVKSVYDKSLETQKTERFYIYIHIYISLLVFSRIFYIFLLTSQMECNAFKM